jgi:hypothetical protein
MEHGRALDQMRAHLARAEREVKSARRFLEVPSGGSSQLALARALANASVSIHDALDTIQQILHEQHGS